MNDVFRDVAMLQAVSANRPSGKSYIAVIGIDRYRGWRRLYNAVADAHGTLRSFTHLGFEPACAPLLDDMATGDALHRLVTDDLSTLGAEDSLVLFFAGHGHTITRKYHGDSTVKDGYLIPVDGEPPDGRRGTWLRIDSWLAEVTRIQARHILVVIDACHSGLALGPIIKWRNRGSEDRLGEPLERLRARSSRRIITSALDDQLAMDAGPVPGHSLFTGCLIEGLGGGIGKYFGHTTVTGTEIAQYLQRRVCEYPESRQTPDFGALELDDRGELLVHLAAVATQRGLPPPPRGLAPATALRPSAAAASPRTQHATSARPTTPATSALQAETQPASSPMRPASPSWRRSRGAMLAAGACAAGGLIAMLVRSSGGAPGSISPVPPTSAAKVASAASSVDAAPARSNIASTPTEGDVRARGNATRADAQDLAGTLASANLSRRRFPDRHRDRCAVDGRRGRRPRVRHSVYVRRWRRWIRRHDHARGAARRGSAGQALREWRRRWWRIWAGGRTEWQRWDELDGTRRAWRRRRSRRHTRRLRWQQGRPDGRRRHGSRGRCWRWRWRRCRLHHHRVAG